MRRSVVLFETIVAAVSIVIWAIMLAMSFGITYPSSAHFVTGGGSFPFLMSLLLIILNGFWLVDNLLILKRGATDENAQPPLLTYLFGTKEQTRRLVLIALLVILYVFGLIPLCGMIHPTYGFLIATVVYLLCSIKMFAKFSWVKTILISVITAGLIFLAMNNILMLPMPR